MIDSKDMCQADPSLSEDERAVDEDEESEEDEKLKIFPERYPSDPCTDFLGDSRCGISLGSFKCATGPDTAVGESGAMESSR